MSIIENKEERHILEVKKIPYVQLIAMNINVITIKNIIEILQNIKNRQTQTNAISMFAPGQLHRHTLFSEKMETKS